MDDKIPLKKHWEENVCLLIIILCFIELLSKRLHDILKWPMAFLGIFLLFGCMFQHKAARKKATVILGAFLLSGLELVFSEGILFTQYMWDLCICMPVALGIYCTKHVNPRKWIVLYCVVSAYLLIRLYLAPDRYTVFYSHSRNYISVFLIIMMFLNALIADKAGKRLPGWMIYVSVITSILSIGRGGIVACMFIAGLYLLYQVHKTNYSDNKKVKILCLMILTLVLVIAFIAFGEEIIEKIFPRFGKASAAANSSSNAVIARFRMWELYVQGCFHSANSFIWGMDPARPIYEVRKVIDFNLHNSYLQLHTFYGIIGFFFAMFCAMRFLYRYYRMGKMEIVILFLGYLLRCLTDQCFPGVLSGIGLWAAIFFSRQRKQRGEQYESNRITA